MFKFNSIIHNCNNRTFYDNEISTHVRIFIETIKLMIKVQTIVRLSDSMSNASLRWMA